jgi:C1A family cysteine protease
MKFIVIFAVLVLVASCVSDRALFKEFKNKFNKKYAAEEEAVRFSIFQGNLKMIREHNAGDHSYTMGINQFTDLTQAEFEQMYLRPIESPKEVVVDTQKSTAPDSIDWRTQGAVTPIKDQGQCGSCWAFSTTGGMEGCVKIASGSLISMSEQQLVDCDKTSYGCNGGLMTNAYNYIIKHGGICSEAAYPYTARTGTCKDTTCTSVATLSGFTNIATGSVSGLQNACAIEPVSIAVDASNFSPYRSGIFSNCGTSLNHGITLVGYLVNQYWICKNSWGTSWGEAGYIRLAWGNTCGIANMATYPTGCRKL